MSETLAEPRVVRNAIDRALKRLSEADWHTVLECAANLADRVNARNPKVHFEIIDAIEVIGKLGIFLAGARRR